MSSSSRVAARSNSFLPPMRSITHPTRALLWVAATTLLVLAAVVAGGAENAVMRLERRSTTNISTEHLVKMDQRRHAGRGLLGVVDLPVTGTGYSYPEMIGGPYLTRVQMGSPPKNFSMLIDTGSSIPWVSCQPQGAPELSAPPGLFDPKLSATSSLLPCSDSRCKDMIRTGFAVCRRDLCEYDLLYGPPSIEYSSTTGYYILDIVNLEILEGSTSEKTSSAPLLFGCSTYRSGELSEDTFDGIFGFGPYMLSFNSQLHSLGLSFGVFSICMRSSYGGGILVFGEVLEPGIVYTPLVTSMYYYQVNMESISVNGHKLAVDPSVFKPLANQGTIVDSGTTLAYLADGAFEPFIDAIAAAVSPSVQIVVKNGDRCFVTSSSVELLFPSLTLHFAGGAAMTLTAKNYLRSEDEITYCIAWQRSYRKQITILGDIVLMDKIIVHDLENMLLGWMDYNCSQSVNVISQPRKKHVSSAHAQYRPSILTGIAVILAFFYC